MAQGLGAHVGQEQEMPVTSGAVAPTGQELDAAAMPEAVAPAGAEEAARTRGCGVLDSRYTGVQQTRLGLGT